MDQSTEKELAELMPTSPGIVGEDAHAVAELGAELRAGRRRVFFYAASGFDWQPLHRFSHLCDCFVYVEPRARQSLWGQAKVEWDIERSKLIRGETRAGENLRGSQLLAFDEAYNALTNVVGPLAEMRHEPWARVPDLQDRPAWGAVEKLKRRVGGRDRIIWLVFIAGNPLLVYRRLFIDTHTAPVVLALCTPEFPEPADGLLGIVENHWTQFAGYDGELGQLVRGNGGRLPEFLVAENPGMGWPVAPTRYSIPFWRRRWATPVLPLNHAQWPDLVPAPEAGARRVVLTRRPLNPHSAKRVAAIVLSNEDYRDYQWPAGVLAILNGPPVYPEYAIPNGPTVANVNIQGKPLLHALAQIEAVCAERGITKVAVQGLPGFEDEADDLNLWRQKRGQIEELILHVRCDGHFIDYAPVADELD